jgi:hypothetical protein
LIEPVRVLELVRLPPVHEVLLVDPEVLHDAVRDVRVPQLVVDDRRHRNAAVDRGGVPGRQVVGRRTHELGVALHRELGEQRLLVARGHVLLGLDHEAVGDPVDQLLFRRIH